MADGVDIDLYADVEDFKTTEAADAAAADLLAPDLDTSEDNGGNAADLYEDVLASTSSAAATNADGGKVEHEDNALADHTMAGEEGKREQPGYPARRYQIYVGNLTWWTTDQDIADEVSNAGVNDFLEVKFYENRANGQSKGFCCVSLGSEESMRVLMDKLPKKEMHGQAPVVTYATKQALMQFESQSKTRPPSGPPQGPPPPMGGDYRSSRPMGYRPPMSRGGYVPRGMPPRGPPPVHGGPPPMRGGPRGPPPMHGSHHHSHGPPPHVGGPPPRAPPPGMPPGPAPHVNPAFFAGGSSSSSSSYPPAHGLSEAEFEDIMGRNRTVSSSAIARAVQDAANGEFASAIETLVTAISLIKQSKVAGDDRCKILISSLGDTLRGIEHKSYSSRRERSRSRERHHHYPSSSHHHYPGSREREYRGRSRERDYHHHHSSSHHEPRREYRSRSREREERYRREKEYYEEKRRYEEERRRGDPERERGESSSSRRREDEPRSGDREKERSRH